MNMISALLNAQPSGGSRQANKNNVIQDHCHSQDEKSGKASEEAVFNELSLERTGSTHWNGRWQLGGENSRVHSRTHEAERLSSGND